MNTVWVLGDQLSMGNAAVAREGPKGARVLMVESKGRGSVMRYHKVKLALVYSGMRHFARDLTDAGWEVDYHRIDEGLNFETGARRHLQKYGGGKIVVQEPNSFFETDALTKLGRKLKVEVEFPPTTQFLLPREDFRAWAAGQRRLLMENHYRRMRKRFGWLMRPDGQPEGGSWNFDHDNRGTFGAWRKAGKPRTRNAPREEPDDLTLEVMEMVEREFPGNPGQASEMWLPVDRAGALRWLERFLKEGLPMFGIYEDMMAAGEPFLFHSVLSPLINLGFLTPRECIEGAIAEYRKGNAPLNSVEGYLRQIAGWREFINGVYWHRGPEYKELNVLGAERALPAWVYAGKTELNCLHQVVGQTVKLGWNHHIQRLMILGNFFLLAGIKPQEALRWYLEMYVDAFDWVMAANVIGMCLYADGGYMATKPYAATSSYIRKMSDYCAGCRFDPDKKTGPEACPYNYLYWNFMDQHGDRFTANPRMGALVRGWVDRPAGEKEAVRESARKFLEGEMGSLI